MEILELDKELLPVGATAVHIAVNSGQTRGLQSLLDRDSSLVDCPDQHGRTPLTLALQNCRLAAAQLLIQSGAKLDVQFGEDGRTIAIVLVTTPAFYQLLRFVIGCNIALPCEVSSVLPAFTCEGDTDLMERLLDGYGVKVDRKDNLRCTALHYASQNGFVEVVKLLFSHSATVTLTNSSGSTALHLACSAGHLASAKAILELDPSPERIKHLLNRKNTAGYTPITCALRNKHVDLAQYILTTHIEYEDLSQMGPEGHTLSGFCFYLKFFAQQSLIKLAHFSSLQCLSSEEAMWMLHESVYADDTAAISRAVAQGASVECLDYMQQTPLVLAAKLGSVEMCKSLVECGADPNLADESGRIPLVHAIEHGRHECVAYFLSQLSLGGINPNSLTSPLRSSSMLAVLVSYFEDNRWDHKPGNWLAWLALVVPTAPRNLFRSLVNAIAPYDWIQQVITKLSKPSSSAKDSASPKVSTRVGRHPTLPAYVQELLGEPPKPRPKLVRSFSQPRKWYFTRPPPATVTQWTFKHLPRPKKVPTAWKMKGKPFCCNETRAKANQMSVIHKAALHNLDVLKYILFTCEESELQGKLLLLRDETGRTALELALPHFDTISEAVQFLELSECSALDEYLSEKFPLPESVLFEEVLVQYLCLDQDVMSSQCSRRLQSPLQAWPLWYLQQQVNAVCANYGSGSLLLAKREDKKELLQILLDHNFLPRQWSEALQAYPPPLFAAIRHNCAWAVEPLLLHGADPATHYHDRLAIEEAAKRSQVEVVELLLRDGFAPFLALAAQDSHLFSSLPSALVPLINAGRIECMIKLIKLMEGANLSQCLWCSHSAPHFLFVAQAVCNGSGAYETVVRDFVTYLCTVMLRWESESSQVCKAVLRNLAQLHHRCFLDMACVSDSTKNLRLLIATSECITHVFQCITHAFQEEVKFGEFFHFLCGSGNHELTAYVLSSNRNSNKELTNKPDTRGLSPLVYAACGGHLTIVKLLREHGAELNSSTGMSPVMGALLYLALAPYNAGGDVMGKPCGFIRRQRLQHVGDFRKLIPKICSFSRLIDADGDARELVSQLLPPESESIYSHLSSVPAEYKVLHALVSVLLIAAARTSSHLEPLLRRIAQEAMASSFRDSFKKASASSEVQANGAKYESLLGGALKLAPANTSSQASQLFESFLVELALDSQFYLTGVFSAAKKGYWDVLHKAVSTNGIGSYKAASRSITKRHTIALLQSCLLAVKAGKVDTLRVLLNAGQSSQFFETQWWPQLISAAVCTGHLEEVRELIAAGCNPLYGLRTAARFGKVEVLNLLLESLTAGEVVACFVELLMIAARCNQQPIVQSLFDLYQKNHELSIENEQFRDVSFWVCVLVHATKSGHQYMALQAVACISEKHMNSLVSKHRLYPDVLYYACYWGLTELLECLPHSDDALLTRLAYDSPTEAAIANGKLGCIPACSNFPLIADLDSWLEKSPLNLTDGELFDVLMTGYFHHLCTVESLADHKYRNSVESTQVEILTPPHVFHLVPNAFAAFERLTGKFCAPVLMYAVQKDEFNLVNVAAEGGNSSLLEQVLRVLHSSDYLSTYCSHSDLSPLSVAVRSGHASCVEMLLRSGEAFVKQLVDVDRAGQNILHITLQAEGHSVAALTTVLDWLADSAPDMCFALDHAGNSPLFLAFSLGEHERAVKLLERAQLSSKWLENAEPDWRAEAKKVYGWDRAMMKYERKFYEDQADLVPVQFNIRPRRMHNATKMFTNAVRYSNSDLVKALLVASCGLLLEDKVLLSAGLLDQSVLEFLSACPLYVSLKQLDATKIVCKALRQRDCSKEVELLIRLSSQKQLSISMNQNEVFHSACAIPRQTLVCYFLKNATIPSEVLQNAALEALNKGALEVAAAILLLDPSLVLDIPWAPAVMQTIFITVQDYQTTVEDFFGSLARHEAMRCLPFSEAWLTHKWGPFQTQLLEKKLGGAPGVPSNPWMLGVLWREKSLTVTITVDWKSFADCLQDSSSRHVPMLVEAAVFSSAVLGQLCLKEDRADSVYNLADLFDCPHPLSSLVVSAVRWPHPPSAGLASSNEGLLTLSYRPEDRVFTFPPVSRTEKGWGDVSYSTDSGMQLFCFTDTSIEMNRDESTVPLPLEMLNDLSGCYKRKMKRMHDTSTSIEVEGFSGESDYTMSYAIVSALQTVINDCSEALKLASLPSTLYANISHSKGIDFPRVPPKKKLFSHIGVTIDAAAKGENSSAVVSLVDSALDFSIALVMDNSLSPPYIVSPSFESLLQQTVGCALNREVEILKKRLMQVFSVQIVHRLQRSIRSEIDMDMVEMLLEDNSGVNTTLSAATINHLPVLKALSNITKFLRHFCDIIQAFSHKPKLFASLRSSLQSGLRVVVSEVNSTELELHPLVQLTVHTRDLSYPQRQTALLSLTSSLLEQQAPLRDHTLNSLLGDVPCPFLTHVVLDRSMGFLYPTIGSVAKLVVQVVSYDQQKLRLPVKYTCCLRVVICSPDSNTLKASSSDDPRPSAASANLFITTSGEGQFEVSWKPKEKGLHSVFLTLNGAAIQETFKKVFVVPELTSCVRRQVTAGSPMAFIAAHVGYGCPHTSKTSTVVLTEPTVIKPHPSLRSIPEYKVFSSQCDSPSSVGVSPLSSPSSTFSVPRTPARLREVVTGMTGSSPGNLNHHDLPLLHHLSVTAAYGGSSRWTHTPTDGVTVHVTPEEKSKKQGKVIPNGLKASSFSLGNGMHSVLLYISRTATYKVFASCPVCQSVMKIYWFDQQSFFPHPYYVLPGPISAHKSKLLAAIPPNCHRKLDGVHSHLQLLNTEGWEPGPHAFFLMCFDDFGNAHTIGGSVKRAVVKGGGGRPDTLPLPVLVPPELDAVCKVKHLGGGLYCLVCIIEAVGTHPLLVTDTLRRCLSMATLHIQHGPVSPLHCRLDSGNKYEATVFKEYTCHIYLYDDYFNPCHHHKSCHEVVVFLNSVHHSATLSRLPRGEANRFALKFSPKLAATSKLTVIIDQKRIGGAPPTIRVTHEHSGSFQMRFQMFRKLIVDHLLNKSHHSPFIMFDRSSILESALRNLNAFRTSFRVMFQSERGIDFGGLASEFFHLLSLELVNPQYALFQCANSLYRPSPHSSVNPNHLQYFDLCGRMLARMICDNRQTVVHFTPAVYKFLLSQKCSLEDLKIEDPVMHKGLMEIASCDSDEALDLLAIDFTASHAHFGSLKTVELERGGHEKRVTISNRYEFISKLCHWHLIGCIHDQLVSMREGLNLVLSIPDGIIRRFTSHELEMILTGQPTIDLSFMKSRTKYCGYTAWSSVVVWLWEALESFSHEEQCQFLQFTTGSACLPSANTSQWEMEVKRGSQDESLLPTASTCFNSLTLPCYTQQASLRQKLLQAISYGQKAFLIP